MKHITVFEYKTLTHTFHSSTSFYEQINFRIFISTQKWREANLSLFIKVRLDFTEGKSSYMAQQQQTSVYPSKAIIRITLEIK
jgi:hypothetical protein